MPVITEVHDYQNELTAIRRYPRPPNWPSPSGAQLIWSRPSHRVRLQDPWSARRDPIIGTMRGGNSPAAIGLRADMDADPPR